MTGEPSITEQNIRLAMAEASRRREFETSPFVQDPRLGAGSCSWLLEREVAVGVEGCPVLNAAAAWEHKPDDTGLGLQATAWATVTGMHARWPVMFRLQARRGLLLLSRRAAHTLGRDVAAELDRRRAAITLGRWGRVWEWVYWRVARARHITEL